MAVPAYRGLAAAHVADRQALYKWALRALCAVCTHHVAPWSVCELIDAALGLEPLVHSLFSWQTGT
jgi:hypothetical protein